ncbi:MAG: phosphomethylpyrimidine synthase ThiC [Candidatus Altarchaeaceae archaeon]
MIEEIKEGIITKEKLEKYVNEGSVVILKNKEGEEVLGIGKNLKTKINANIGIGLSSDVEKEIEKGKVAIKYGADTLMDLSISNFDEIRREILKNFDVPIGTVPIYQAYIEKKGKLSEDHIFNVIEKNLKDGVSFATIHAGITMDLIKNIKKFKRYIPITSRGGALIAAYMINNDTENPLYKNFDYILELFKKYDACISLGDALRPGTILDSNDYAQFGEVINLGKLTKKAREKKVKVIVEGPGHIPLNEIESSIKITKKICDNAPLYTLGPLPTDIALGYDHIASAIGGAIGVMYGVDFLCYVTPSEHYSLPDIEDVKQGVIAAKIAAYVGDIVKLGNFNREKEMTIARRNLDWDKIFELGIDKNLKKPENLKNKNPCTMCGEYCALKIVEKFFDKNDENSFNDRWK